MARPIFHSRWLERWLIGFHAAYFDSGVSSLSRRRGDRLGLIVAEPAGFSARQFRWYPPSDRRIARSRHHWISGFPAACGWRCYLSHGVQPVGTVAIYREFLRPVLRRYARDHLRAFRLLVPGGVPSNAYFVARRRNYVGFGNAAGHSNRRLRSDARGGGEVSRSGARAWRQPVLCFSQKHLAQSAPRPNGRGGAGGRPCFRLGGTGAVDSERRHVQERARSGVSGDDLADASLLSRERRALAGAG